MEITDGPPLVVPRFTSPSQVVCILTLSDNRSAAVAALDMGCTIIAADDDQSVIDDIIRELSDLASDSSHNDPESERSGAAPGRTSLGSSRWGSDAAGLSCSPSPSGAVHRRPAASLAAKGYGLARRNGREAGPCCLR